MLDQSIYVCMGTLIIADFKYPTKVLSLSVNLCHCCMYSLCELP